ncbi:MAG TPA: tetratricopeptide repeat protein [Spirochaetota bacterium]|nr:tetratricopeptide repeat protein [Spirochaetota bacterium]HPF05805.1 tetratricopeptide repeat protein [Spirochaetota bacterium]HPJ42934.1 tetratricopeptide repeat protein [Spirochaetota bacterium]HPR37500.1 tetratricopeptide repeat protein [Spirochaetota bacterium]HRX47282.1 tetratricopeptide repeat protein [Spirochaetota bacterium]
MMKKLILIFLVVFVSSSAFAAYDNALALYQENKFKESLAVCAEDLVMADDFRPGSPNYKIRYLAAHNHWKLGNIESASIHFRKCMAIEKTKIDPYIDLSMLLIEKRKFKEAGSVIEDGLKVKEDAMLFWLLGRIAVERTDYQRAKTLFERANGIDPEFYVSYNDLGIALMKLGKYGDANAAFSVAYAINGDSAEINNNMAYCLYKMGKNNEAIPYIKKALELSSDKESIKALAQKIENK